LRDSLVFITRSPARHTIRGVSVPVALERLRDEVATYGSAAFVITVSDDGRPHVVSTRVSWNDDELIVAAGRHTLANAGARATATLLWPPVETGGYSLIVDGESPPSAQAGPISLEP